MIKAHSFTSETIRNLEGIYGEFRGCAQEKYCWSYEPVEFSALQNAISNRLIRGYWVEDTSEPEPIAFMLYTIEEHRAIEINVIYIKEGRETKTVMDRLMRLFIEEIKQEPGWEVVSYAMLGEQDKLIRTICWYGFKPVGQSIVRFDFTDSIAVQILKQQNLPTLPDGYTLDTWRPEYAGEIAQSVYEAFSTASDAKWDPRFRTLLGARKAVGMIQSGMFGKFLPACTSVLLKESVPMGFCFIVEADISLGNIPLIGVRADEKFRGLGNHLLKHSLERTIQEFLEAKISIIAINATLDTDNYAAIKMYRRMGFKEEHHYPHTYLTREKALAYIPGKWC